VETGACRLKQGIFVDVSILWWVGLLVGILIMLAIDLFLHRKAHVIAFKEAAWWSALWVAIGLGFGALVWWAFGSEFGLQYFSGYIIEKSLAVDNVFVWAMIFTYFAVPREYQHRVLFYGVLGALIFRGIFIAAGSWLIASFAWTLLIFGGFLIVTGVRMLIQRNEHIDIETSKTLRLFRRLVPMTDEYVGQKFLIRRSGRLLATPLLAVVVIVEVTDIIFAVDSIPAIFAITQEPFLVFSSNALAILGLRAMYFLLADLMHRFIYLKLGLSLVLVWVGVKMIVSHLWVKIPTVTSLGIVVTLITVSIVASLWATRQRTP
jgi:tellurite resistance protein TerC